MAINAPICSPSPIITCAKNAKIKAKKKPAYAHSFKNLISNKPNGSNSQKFDHCIWIDNICWISKAGEHSRYFFMIKEIHFY